MIAVNALMRAGGNWDTWHIPCEWRMLQSILSANRIRATRPDAYKPIHSEGAGAQVSCLKEIDSAVARSRRRKGGDR
jgi:hypothetical protein